MHEVLGGTSCGGAYRFSDVVLQRDRFAAKAFSGEFALPTQRLRDVIEQQSSFGTRVKRHGVPPAGKKRLPTGTHGGSDWIGTDSIFSYLM